MKCMIDSASAVGEVVKMRSREKPVGRLRAMFSLRGVLGSWVLWGADGWGEFSMSISEVPLLRKGEGLGILVELTALLTFDSAC
jgi:hypothetical protein